MQENKQEFSIIKKRILEFLKKEGISMYKCYQETGMSRGVLGQKNGISEENLIKFLKTYHKADPKWITLGEISSLPNEIEQDYKEKVKLKIQEVTPDYILKRYEELVIENNELKTQLKAQKKEVQYMHGIEQTLVAAEPQIELNDKEKKE